MLFSRSFFSAPCATVLLLCAHTSRAFSFSANKHQSHARGGITSLKMSHAGDNGSDSRRSFLSKVAATSAAAAAGSSVGFSGFPTSPAYAIGGGLKKVNARLQAYGLPTIDSLPNGFTPLLELYGKGKNRFPLLVEFLHPIDWVVVLPSNDKNGEDGTIQAGEYAKGDSATLYVYTDPGKVENVASQPKSFFENAIIKAISQKGDNVYQNFKITKVDPIKGEYKDQDYVLVDFKYELLTGAGFLVDRVGVASVTSVGDAVEVLWTASTRQRYKKTEPVLRDIAKSFRVYADGLNLSDELLAFDE